MYRRASPLLPTELAVHHQLEGRGDRPTSSATPATRRRSLTARSPHGGLAAFPPASRSPSNHLSRPEASAVTTILTGRDAVVITSSGAGPGSRCGTCPRRQPVDQLAAAVRIDAMSGPLLTSATLAHQRGGERVDGFSAFKDSVRMYRRVSSVSRWIGADHSASTVSPGEQRRTPAGSRSPRHRPRHEAMRISPPPCSPPPPGCRCCRDGNTTAMRVPRGFTIRKAAIWFLTGR